MPDGNLITQNYQFQLHNTLYGCGSNGVSIEYGKTIEGLGVPDAKTADVDYARAAGVYANPDYLPIRLITIPVIMKGTETAVMTNLKALSLAWIPLTTDTDLAFKLPGWNLFEVHGRPRGAKFDLSLERSGAIRVLLRFDCPDPTITYL